MSLHHWDDLYTKLAREYGSSRHLVKNMLFFMAYSPESAKLEPLDFEKKAREMLESIGWRRVAEQN